LLCIACPEAGAGCLPLLLLTVLNAAGVLSYCTATSGVPSDSSSSDKRSITHSAGSICHSKTYTASTQPPHHAQGDLCSSAEGCKVCKYGEVAQTHPAVHGRQCGPG
jgi:hypothetical protein